MQVLGGVRKEKDIRRCLNERTPQCRKFGSASAMRLAVEKLKAARPVEASNIHRAKGKEWRHVFIIGVTDGVLPDYRSTSQARLDDERKALFVAATRASETLTLVHAPQVLQPRHSPVLKALRPSRFLHAPEVRARTSLRPAHGK
jgi:DNA helicase-2/ATP-dependent DNA helicase PcrA